MGRLVHIGQCSCVGARASILRSRSALFGEDSKQLTGRCLGAPEKLKSLGPQINPEKSASVLESVRCAQRDRMAGHCGVYRY